MLLMGVMADKEHGRMIKMLSPLTCRAFTVTPENARSLDSVGVMREFSENGVEAQSYPSID